MTRLTRQQAINEMCKQCIYDPVGSTGTWKQQTEACTSHNCPLYPYRPKSRTSLTTSESGSSNAESDTITRG